MLRIAGALLLAAAVAGLAFGLSAVASVAVYRAVPPAHTPLMVLRAAQRRDARPARWRWRSLDRISPNLVRAAIAAEDSRFCSHTGFDWREIREALKDFEETGGFRRGASTISMQTAKNVFLTPHRSFFRKGLEAGFTVLIEAMWGKRRILETYLNVAEWGPGIYGAEAAARAWFRRAAARLTPDQAALLASTLPGPLRWQPDRPNARIRRKARIVRERMRLVKLEKDRACGG
ncbi:MAG: monofunctional biosynthetic peptidoglycan transglycosylase [Rhodospirillaceae bacterium]|nr:monofunctional biosynthetic peptidoglycan transglycosylase [Rhodospirillaceae bacterium]MCY4064789.1 monofunctional biosynthetic peptidoglycan transglycosylase [Rhodospirillaceae bacterium]